MMINCLIAVELLFAPACKQTHVITVETEYYKTGPQQAQPPDGKFPKGTKVVLLITAGSYCSVSTEVAQLVRKSDGLLRTG